MSTIRNLRLCNDKPTDKIALLSILLASRIIFDIQRLCHSLVNNQISNYTLCFLIINNLHNLLYRLSFNVQVHRLIGYKDKHNAELQRADPGTKVTG